MASRDPKDLTPKAREIWENSKEEWVSAYPNRAVPFLTATHRSNEEQTKLYNQPRDGKDNDGDGKIDEKDEKVTNAKAGQSMHNRYPSPAFDIAFKKANQSLDWSEILFSDFAVIAKKHGAEWGGDWQGFKDTPHFQEKGL